MKDQAAFYRLIGSRIRTARGKDISQDALALAIGLSRSSISNIEKGRQKLLLHTLWDIADALRVPPPSLLAPAAPVVEATNVGQLASLAQNERSFIESAIGIAHSRGEADGDQEKANTRTGGLSVARGERNGRARSGMGHSTKEGRANRR